jgi:hypothetical protein
MQIYLFIKFIFSWDSQGIFPEINEVILQILPLCEEIDVLLDVLGPSSLIALASFKSWRYQLCKTQSTF